MLFVFFHFSSRRKNSKFAKNIFDKVKIYLVVPVAWRNLWEYNIKPNSLIPRTLVSLGLHSPSSLLILYLHYLQSCVDLSWRKTYVINKWYLFYIYFGYFTCYFLNLCRAIFLALASLLDRESVKLYNFIIYIFSIFQYRFKWKIFSENGEWK